jgi:hypothetical protein
VTGHSKESKKLKYKDRSEYFPSEYTKSRRKIERNGSNIFRERVELAS